MTSHRVLKLSDSETTRFLRLYEKEKALYNPTLDEYRDRNMRAAAAKRISDALRIRGFGPKEVITKFKNLRSSYCQELKKIAESEKTGTDDIYKPKVFWFDHMHSFIRRFVQRRSAQPDIVSITDDFESNINQEPEIDDLSIFKKEFEDHILIKTESVLELPENHKKRERTHFSDESHSSNSQKRKCTQDNESVDESQDMPNRAPQFITNKDDSYDHFGRYIASLLRTIGPPKAIRLQQKITTLVTDAMCPLENPMDSDQSRPSVYSGRESSESVYFAGYD